MKERWRVNVAATGNSDQMPIDPTDEHTPESQFDVSATTARTNPGRLQSGLSGGPAAIDEDGMTRNERRGWRSKKNHGPRHLHWLADTV